MNLMFYQNDIFFRSSWYSKTLIEKSSQRFNKMQLQTKLVLVLMLVFLTCATADHLSGSFSGWCWANGGDDACSYTCRQEGSISGYCGDFLGARCWCQP
uniref:Defensin n=1 Tax=Panagrolaimus sp. JU765 TaxID=591449 RepID=A0AC34QCW0_9BILA